MANNELKITNCFSTTSTTYAPNREVWALILHYTAGVTSKKGSALNTAKWFASGSNPNNPASSDFQVDDGEVVQYNCDLTNRYAWTAGGSTNYNKTNAFSKAWVGKAVNKNTINIEICSNKKNTKTLNADDRDWYFTESELELTAKLVRYLMYVFDIPLERVGMHNTCTGKLCPAMWTWDNDSLDGYYDFLERVKNTPIPTVSGGNFPKPKGKKDAVLVMPERLNKKVTTNTSTPTTQPPTPTSATKRVPYIVKIIDPALNVRAKADLYSKVVDVLPKGGAYTIVKEIKNGQQVWGQLKSGVGYINVSDKYVQFVRNV